MEIKQICFSQYLRISCVAFQLPVLNSWNNRMFWKPLGYTISSNGLDFTYLHLELPSFGYKPLSCSCTIRQWFQYSIGSEWQTSQEVGSCYTFATSWGLEQLWIQSLHPCKICKNRENRVWHILYFKSFRKKALFLSKTPWDYRTNWRPWLRTSLKCPCCDHIIRLFMINIVQCTQ